MRAIRFDRFGEPSEVLRVEDRPDPEPRFGEVVVRMTATPINPSDLLVVRGLYGVLPQLPATPGFEGVGVVEDGRGPIAKLLVGRRVAVINQAGGNWAERVCVPALRAIPVPADLPDDQAASFFVNPATVLAMVRHVLQVPRGAWLLQSAAGSALGKMIIKLGIHDGFRTINVVRRPSAIAELQALGGDAVISTTDGPIERQVEEITGGAMVRYALDPVGGDIGTGVFNSLAADSRMLVYGTLSNEPIRVDSRRMIAGKRVVEGFWLGHWMQGRSKIKAVPLFREIARLIRSGVLSTDPGPRFPLEAIQPAARAAEAIGKAGKVLLTL
ncbi:MAG: zinc-dependent alcohol dehydrogenase family protein [Isosphaeraceae bacterium]|nr:zinc-dependent alcohol dehydrogenase family protein [Isosphaeraceae bacterium]